MSTKTGAARHAEILTAEEAARTPLVTPDTVQVTKEQEEAYLILVRLGWRPSKACDETGMPTWTQICRLRRVDPEGFGKAFDQAREEGYERMADEVIEIADNVDPDQVKKAEVRIKARQWYLSMVSANFRPKSEVNVRGGVAVGVAKINDNDRVVGIERILRAALMRAAQQNAVEGEIIDHGEPLA